MGWSVGFDNRYNRDIGYGVPALCDHPDCNKEIDRGLAYVCCNQQPYGGEDGCGLYFCDKHRDAETGKCERCLELDEDGLASMHFNLKPDLEKWTNFKMTDDSWKQWRIDEGLEKPNE